MSAGSRAPTLNSMPAAANAASAVPARGRQVVSCGLDRGFLAAGGVGWVAGQAVGAIAPSEKPVAGADAAWAMDGRGMDTTGEAPPRQCADIQRQQCGIKDVLGTDDNAGQLSCMSGSVLSVVCRIRQFACVPHRPVLAVRDARQCSQLQCSTYQASNASSGHI